jgi:cytochrome c oxidase subunit 2
VTTLRDVHLPTNTPTRIRLMSDDYVYTFAVPHFGVNQIAVPEMVFPVDLQPTAVGTYELLGDQLCGYAHPALLGKLVVDTEAGFTAWLDRQREQR